MVDGTDFRPLLIRVTLPYPAGEFVADNLILCLKSPCSLMGAHLVWPSGTIKAMEVVVPISVAVDDGDQWLSSRIRSLYRDIGETRGSS